MSTTEFTAEMATEAVNRGALWLDQQCPDWVKEIDPDCLDMDDGDRCVLGQTAECLAGKPRGTNPQPGYLRVVNRRGVSRDGRWVVDHGFQVPWTRLALDKDEELAAYEMLEIAWRELIRERLAVPV